MAEPILRLTDVSKYYTTAGSIVVGLNSLNLSFTRGEFVAVTGESGSGKSTLSHVIGGILPYENGELYLNGKPTSHYDSADWERYRRDNISFISQSYGILPGTTVLGNVITALRLSGMEKKDARAAAKDILLQVELWELRNRRAAKLSSGQKQRLSIARALAKPAPILIADEPTGNLDPENSAKVIALLAKAAESRLVILVTHEFSEAAHCATRRITLQDGKVTMDAPLREPNTPEKACHPEQAKRAEGSAFPTASRVKHTILSPYVSRLQLTSRPVWTTLMALLFSLTAFAVFAFLGTFIIALDDTGTRIYDARTFRNGAKERIIAANIDGSPMTQADYEAILGLEYVTQLERNGYLTDVQYAYRDGEDYTTIYTEEVSPTLEHTISISYRLHADAPFLQSVPLLPGGEMALTQGRLPESFYEVVAQTGDGLAIGDTVTVFLTDRAHWGNGVYERQPFTVVGLTDHGEGLYFHNDVGRFFQHVHHSDNGSNYFFILPDNPASNREKLASYTLWQEYSDDVTPSLDLTDSEMRLSSSLYTQYVDPKSGNYTVTLGIPNINLEALGLDPYAQENRVVLSTPETKVYTEPSPGDGQEPVIETLHNHLADTRLTRLVQVSQKNFDLLTWQSASEQVSLTIEDYAYTDRVLTALDELGYVAVSPFQHGSAQVDEEKAAERKQTLTVCLAALAAVVALQVVLLRFLFNSQLESYELLRNIGLTAATAKRSVLWQILFLTALGQIMGCAAIWYCGRLGIERIVTLLRYLPPVNVLILSAVHLTASLLAAAWVARSLGRQVYPATGFESDLNFDSEEAAV